MKKNILLFISLFLAVTFTALGKDPIIVKGIVLGNENSEPIPYVSVSVEGTFTGCSTDTKGRFEFSTKEDFANHFLVVSCVGYKTIRLSWSQIKVNQDMLFKLEKQVLSINNVDVSAKSLVLYKVLRETNKRISENFLSTPFMTRNYYHNTISYNKNNTKESEAALELFDKKGYHKQTEDQEFKSRNYRFTEEKKNYVVKTYSDGLTPMDEMLKADIVRSTGNVLDLTYIRDYDLSSDDKETFEGQPAWVINYTLNKPDVARTGYQYVSSYKGKIYILKNNYEVVKNEMWITTSNKSKQGTSIIMNPLLKVKGITHHISTLYRKVQGKYIVALIRSEETTLFNDKSGNEIVKENKTDLLTTELIKNVTTPFEGRDYFLDIPYKESFWKSYNFIID